jgi:hypothetical protein
MPRTWLPVPQSVYLTVRPGEVRPHDQLLSVDVDGTPFVARAHQRARWWRRALCGWLGHRDRPRWSNEGRARLGRYCTRCGGQE